MGNLGTLLSKHLVISFALQVVIVQSYGIFEVVVTSMHNPRNLLSSGKCCGATSSYSSKCSVQCMTYFEICLTLNKNSQCIRKARSQNFSTSNIDAGKFTESERRIQITITFSWQGFIIGVNVLARDATSGQSIIKTQKINENLLPGLTWKSANFTTTSSSLQYKFRVVCSKDYFGQSCTTYCKARDDQHGHWNCSENGDRICLPGWNGTYCNIAICKQPCVNGNCLAPGKCSCFVGWRGPQCDQCLARSTCVHGRCFRVSRDCVCNPGWSGINCDKELDYCGVHQPCLNGATCEDGKPGEYSCACRQGYTGKNCETSIAYCTHTTCMSGGTCLNTTFGPKCLCPNNSTGQRCENIINGICHPGQCLNGGTCIARKNITVCLCIWPFFGARCQQRNQSGSIHPTRSTTAIRFGKTESEIRGTDRASLIVTYPSPSVDLSSSVFLGSVSLVQIASALPTENSRIVPSRRGQQKSREIGTSKSHSLTVSIIKATSMSATSRAWENTTAIGSTPSTRVTKIEKDSDPVPLAAAITISLSVLILVIFLLLFLWRRVHKYRRPSRISDILPPRFMLPGPPLEAIAGGKTIKIGKSTAIKSCSEELETCGQVNKSFEGDCPVETGEKNNNSNENKGGGAEEIHCISVEKLVSEEDVKNAYINNGYTSGRSSGYSSQTSSARSSATYRKRDSVQAKGIEAHETDNVKDDLVHHTSHNLKHVSFEGLPNYIMYSEESI